MTSSSDAVVLSISMRYSWSSVNTTAVVPTEIPIVPDALAVAPEFYGIKTQNQIVRRDSLEYSVRACILDSTLNLGFFCALEVHICYTPVREIIPNTSAMSGRVLRSSGST